MGVLLACLFYMVHKQVHSLLYDHERNLFISVASERSECKVRVDQLVPRGAGRGKQMHSHFRDFASGTAEAHHLGATCVTPLHCGSHFLRQV